MKTLLRVAQLFVVLGLLGRAYVEIDMWRYQFMPLDESVKIIAGERAIHLFKTRPPLVYQIDLKVDRGTADFETLRCWMDGGSQSKCKEGSKIDVAWKVLSEGQVVAQGEDHSGQRAPNSLLTRTIGSFRAEKGKTYQLEFAPRQGFPEMQAANPRIQVHVNLVDSKGRFVDAAIEALAASIVFAIGLLLYVIYRVRLYVLKRRTRLAVAT